MTILENENVIVLVMIMLMIMLIMIKVMLVVVVQPKMNDEVIKMIKEVIVVVTGTAAAIERADVILKMMNNVR